MKSAQEVLNAISARDDLGDREKERRLGLTRRILELRESRNAILLVHNYQIDEIQDIADISGDSLALAREATKVDRDVIVLCGVQFMAESAAVLNPGKKVLLPEPDAGCPMADMVTAEKLREAKVQYPDAAVVCYVNSTADVKAESDICCTSSNAVRIVKSLEQDRVIFVPDQNLGQWVARHTDKEIILWKGFCSTHHRVRASDIQKAREEHPEAVVVAHPECRPEVLDLADEVCSTQGMFEFAAKSDHSELVICTEKGMLYNLRRENPGKRFYLPSDELVCPTMKMTTLESVVNSLENMVQEISVDPATAEKAAKSLQRMLDVK